MPLPWPYHINDPVQAVHFAVDPDCPYSDSERCPTYKYAKEILEAYKIWQEYRD